MYICIFYFLQIHRFDWLYKVDSDRGRAAILWKILKYLKSICSIPVWYRNIKKVSALYQSGFEISKKVSLNTGKELKCWQNITLFWSGIEISTYVIRKKYQKPDFWYYSAKICGQKKLPKNDLKIWDFQQLWADIPRIG